MGGGVQAAAWQELMGSPARVEVGSAWGQELGGCGWVGGRAGRKKAIGFRVYGLAPPPSPPPTHTHTSPRPQRDEVREHHRALLRGHHERFHPVWGALLKTGYQSSRYGYQIERFAW